MSFTATLNTVGNYARYYIGHKIFGMRPISYKTENEFLGLLANTVASGTVEEMDQLVHLYVLSNLPLSEKDTLDLRVSLRVDVNGSDEAAQALKLDGLNTTSTSIQTRAAKVLHQASLAMYPHLKSLLAREDAKVENDRLQELATTDGLTGLPNRNAFYDYVSRQLALIVRESDKGAKRQAGLLFIDIDKFKLFNDTYGHDVGDEALKHVSRVLEECMRMADFVARWGGEEFVVYGESSDLISFADKVREAIQNSEFVADINGGPTRLPLTISIGTVSYLDLLSEMLDAPLNINGIDDGEIDVDALVKCADIALYYSKETGRNRATSFNDLSPEERVAILDKQVPKNDK